jgi:hypothetical protein
VLTRPTIERIAINALIAAQETHWTRFAALGRVGSGDIQVRPVDSAESFARHPTEDGEWAGRPRREEPERRAARRADGRRTAKGSAD